MGLVTLGLGTGASEAIDKMLQYAHETQPICGLTVGIAFICYGKQEQVDSVIETLLKEKVTG
jgi:26S proteasome regulatory subunit N2